MFSLSYQWIDEGCLCILLDALWKICSACMSLIHQELHLHLETNQYQTDQHIEWCCKMWHVHFKKVVVIAAFTWNTCDMDRGQKRQLSCWRILINHYDCVFIFTVFAPLDYSISDQLLWKCTVQISIFINTVFNIVVSLLPLCHK